MKHQSQTAVSLKQQLQSVKVERLTQVKKGKTKVIAKGFIVMKLFVCFSWTLTSIEKVSGIRPNQLCDGQK